MSETKRVVDLSAGGADPLDGVFFALSDPTRRAILDALDTGPRLVSELAEPFDISLQGVSRHIQVLVRAGLVRQERTGRIARCSLDAAPMLAAAAWINRYTRHWEAQFEALAVLLDEVEERRRPADAPAMTRPDTEPSS